MNVYLPYIARLPSAYQEVEWIGNSGTQYINTGVAVPNHKVIANIEYTNFGNWMSIGAYLGPDSGVPGGEVRLYGGYGNDARNWSYGFLNDFGNYGGSVSSNTKYKLEVSTISGNMYFKHDGTTYGSSSSTYSTSLAGNFGILGSNSAQTWEAWNSAKVYDYKIYDNTNTLVRDFVPCYRKSDSVIGMYDLVNDQFYTNSGTGTFSKGSDVIMSELKNDYIGEYLVPMSGLLGYRPLQSDLKDLSGNGNNGTRYGTGAFDTALGKTGARITNTGSNKITASHIETPLIYGSMPITFCFWADIYTQGNRSGIISNANASDNLTDFCLRTERGNYNLMASLGNGNNNKISTYSLNTWVFYAITIDSSGAWKLYKDGTLSNSGTGANTATNSGYWWIGARNSGGGGSRGIDGLMRHCAIYNRALTDAEILEFYNQTA